ncbi:MAG: MarR family transcriptional regulator [Micropruina sp.]|nr:MarR family transcriptional regulator [Micropruina sp.]
MDFFEALVRYEVALWSAVDRELSRSGQIDLGRLHALRLLERRAGQARVQDLSDDIGITVGAASKLVDRLERDGLAERTPNPANRRSFLICLTHAGEQTLRSGMTVFRAAVAQALGPQDVGAVTAELQRLHRRLVESGIGAAA